MRFEVGQGIKGKIRFKDGTIPEYERVYLVVGVGADYIDVLNLSTIRGKEWKLAFDSNRRIIKYKPPFYKPSFVKLDSLTRVRLDEDAILTILYNGEKLDEEELSAILRMYPAFN